MRAGRQGLRALRACWGSSNCCGRGGVDGEQRKACPAGRVEGTYVQKRGGGGGGGVRGGQTRQASGSRMPDSGGYLLSPAC